MSQGVGHGPLGSNAGTEAVPAGERYAVRDLIVDVAGGVVWRGSEQLVLPPRTFELLVALVRHYPDTVRRQELLERVWPDEVVTDQTLSRRVMALRRALGDHAEEPLYVSGERGFGYRLLGPLERTVDRRAPSTPAPARTPRWVTGLALLLAVVAASLQVGRHPGRTAGDGTGRLTVGVRPALGVRGEVQPVVAEVATAITSALRRTQGVQVSDEWPEAWLEGACQGSTRQMDLEVRLVDAASREPLWMSRFKGDAYEILDRKGAIAVAVARAVQAQARPGVTVPPVPEVAPGVRRACLRGEVAWHSWTPDGLAHAEESWAAALAAAPRHAPAHAGWALTEAVMGLLGHRPPAEAYRQAAEHVGIALEIDPQLPSAQVAAGLVKLLFEWDVAGADPLVRSGAEADPEDLRGVMGLALVLQAEGGAEESVRRLEAATEDDPQSAGAHYLRGQGLQMGGRWDEAAVAYERALALEPALGAARRARAACLSAAGREREALAVLEQPLQAGTPAPTQLREVWRRQCRQPGTRPEAAFTACVLGGEESRATAVLRAGVAEHRPFALFARRQPLLPPPWGTAGEGNPPSESPGGDLR